MKYVSTRGQAPAVSFTDAILAGLAPDGGLYVPETYPSVGKDEVVGSNIAKGHYNYTALNSLWSYAGENWPESARIVNKAYLGGQWPLAVTPLVQIGPGDWALELFHGPSLSFKDIAMQLIGPLFDHVLTERNQRLTVVCATSGDTGGAAVEALKGRDRIDLFVLTPKGRVSDVQRRFMTASGAANVHALEIDGDFDECQKLLKELFLDRDFAARAQLSAVNSINWARILAQSVYYHVASQILCAHGPVDFVVPTGNFGDAFSGYVAKRMGAPIGRIVLATNANDILARAINTGRYERAAHSQATLSPAMDIQVASNFERILFEALDRDGEHARRLYQQFSQSGGFDIPDSALAHLREHFAAASVSDAETAEAMRDYAADGGYLACPHAAVGLVARSKLDTPLKGPLVTLATAHPAKFPETVESATGIRPRLPARCADLFERPEKFDTLAADIEVLKQVIRERSRAWR